MLPLDELYQEVILEHYQNPHNKGSLENPDIVSHGVNPLCGDEVKIFVQLDGEKIKAFKVDGKGCAISQASMSMMSEALQNKSLKEAEKLALKFKESMLEGKPLEFKEYEDVEALEGVKKFPVRIKCAILPWNTFLEGLNSLEGRGKNL
jgi:nitrogen fixation NifU-like protein